MYSVVMAKKPEFIPEPLKRPLMYLFFSLMTVVCFASGINASLKTYHYHEMQTRGMTTTAYLADNGNGKNIPHTRTSRHGFNYTVYYYFRLGKNGQKIYSTDQVAYNNYSRQSRAGQTLKVTYDWSNPKRSYLDRSVYGDLQVYFQILCYFSAALVFGMALGFIAARPNSQPRPLSKTSKYIFYAALVITAVSYLVG